MSQIRKILIKTDTDLMLLSEDEEKCISMPLAETEAPENGTTCFSPDTLNDTYSAYSWSDCPTDYTYLNRGMVYLSQCDAELHNRFMIKLLTLKAV